MDGSAKPYRLGAFPLVESGTGLSWQRSATSCSMAADAFVLSVVAGLVLYLGVGGLLQGRKEGGAHSALCRCLCLGLSLSVCVCVCVRACARARVCARVSLSIYLSLTDCVCVCVCVCV